jgi:hypothetical protein
MWRSWILAGLAGLSAASPGAAQPPPAGTQLYMTQPPAALDRNFGLPTFGMPGSELPQQRTMAPENRTPPPPDFFAGSSNSALPKTLPPSPAFAGMETPLFTTTEGVTTGDTTTSGDTMTTGGMTTPGDRMTNGDTMTTGGVGRR